MAYELHLNFKMFNMKKRKQICIGTFSKIKICQHKASSDFK